MAKNGPILVVEDDQKDRDLLKTAFREAHISNPIIFFGNGTELVQHLKATLQVPFIILCDVNLPREDAVHFRLEMEHDEMLSSMKTPFIFYTSYQSEYAVNEVYKNLTVQGFFQKNNPAIELKDTLRLITDYWKICREPVRQNMIAQA